MTLNFRAGRPARKSDPAREQADCGAGPGQPPRQVSGRRDARSCRQGHEQRQSDHAELCVVELQVPRIRGEHEDQGRQHPQRDCEPQGFAEIRQALAFGCRHSSHGQRQQQPPRALRRGGFTERDDGNHAVLQHGQPALRVEVQPRLGDRAHAYPPHRQIYDDDGQQNGGKVPFCRLKLRVPLFSFRCNIHARQAGASTGTIPCSTARSRTLRRQAKAALMRRDRPGDPTRRYRLTAQRLRTKKNAADTSVPPAIQANV